MFRTLESGLKTYVKRQIFLSNYQSIFGERSFTYLLVSTFSEINDDFPLGQARVRQDFEIL